MCHVLATHHRDSVVHLHPSCFGDQGHQLGPGLHEVGTGHNQDLYTALTFNSFAPPAIVQNAAKEALDVVEANQYRYTARRARQADGESQCLTPAHIVIPAAVPD